MLSKLPWKSIRPVRRVCGAMQLSRVLRQEAAAAVSQSVEEGRDWVAEVEYDSLDNIINTAYVMAREDKDNGKRNFEKRLIPLINEHHSLSAHHALVLLVLMQDVGSANRVTGEKILEAVENRYFSSETFFPPRDADPRQAEWVRSMLGPQGGVHGEFQSFPDFISFMRPDQLAKLIIADDFRFKDEYKDPVKTRPKSTVPSKEKVTTRWKTMDPVDMEAWERDRFLKAQIPFKRMRHVEADVKKWKMRPGNRLRPALGVQLTELIEKTDNVVTLAHLMSSFCYVGEHALFRGDYKATAADVCASAVMRLRKKKIESCIVVIAQSLSRLTLTADVHKAWDSVLLPAIRSLKTRDLAKQAVLPPHLRVNGSECGEFDLAVLVLRALVQSGFVPRTVNDIEKLCQLLSKSLKAAKTVRVESAGMAARLLLRAELNDTALIGQLLQSVDRWREEGTSQRDVAVAAGSLILARVHFSREPLSKKELTVVETLWRRCKEVVDSLPQGERLLLLNAIHATGHPAILEGDEDYETALRRHLLPDPDFQLEDLGQVNTWLEGRSQ
ncbi:hypothetical protein FOZ60_000502 [Perkinsus olseni]|uniref:Uncharacterized protein n=1 Tax=Perkinsus olseni TaxID=32597 RepID=A0A7J6P279_PEROL|nr:hypothetical protein FOZ60_000502 [Perkinsus olseni]